jgi:ribonucleoside-diphosphate reductase alpha chain
VGEVFIHGDRQGSTVAGFCDALALVMSIALQHGVPLELLTGKLRALRFPPSGWTRDDPEVRSVASVPDYLAQWLELRAQRGAA